MLELEIDRLEEIDGSLKNQLKKAGFNSIKDIVIRGPLEVAKSAELSLGEAARLCNNASLLLEQLGVIPNNISRPGNNNSATNKEYIKTGSVELDRLFGGKGVETGAITEFYGHSGSGKTQTCLSLCVMVQQPHPDSKAIYIDTEGKFRPERLSRIAHKKGLDSEKYLQNIKYVRVYNTARLETVIQQNCCSEIAKDSDVKLLVVDAVTSLYRAEYGERSMLSQRQHQLLKVMHVLQNIAHVRNIAVVITNQIQTTPNEWTSKSDIPIGGNVIAHTSTFRIRLRALVVIWWYQGLQPSLNNLRKYHMLLCISWYIVTSLCILTRFQGSNVELLYLRLGRCVLEGSTRLPHLKDLFLH